MVKKVFREGPRNRIRILEGADETCCLAKGSASCILYLRVGGNPHTKLHRLWLLQLRPDQVHDSQS